MLPKTNNRHYHYFEMYIKRSRSNILMSFSLYDLSSSMEMIYFQNENPIGWIFKGCLEFRENGNKNIFWFLISTMLSVSCEPCALCNRRRWRRQQNSQQCMWVVDLVFVFCSVFFSVYRSFVCTLTNRTYILLKFESNETKT